MADVKQNKATTSKKVTVRLPKLNKKNAPTEEFYSVNFKNYIIKRGETVEIPEELAQVIENSQLASEAAFEYAEEKGLKEPKSEL